ncbi:MAG: hypothetical protein ACR2Q3_01685 [Woeseiaceae bacterium]
MKQVQFEKAQEIKTMIKALERARDTMTGLIDSHTPQLDIIDDNDAAARTDLDHIETRNRIETQIAELNQQFEDI